MIGTRLAIWVFGASFALAGLSADALAQTAKSKAGRPKPADTAGADDPAADADATAKADQPPSVLDNPSARLRILRGMIGVGGFGGFGGRGGPGGGRGGPGGGMGGGMTDVLLESPSLQEEIGLTDAQLEALKAAKDEVGKKRNEFFTQLRNQAGANGGRGGNNAGGAPGANGGRGGNNAGGAPGASGGRGGNNQQPGGGNQANGGRGGNNQQPGGGNQANGGRGGNQANGGRGGNQPGGAAGANGGRGGNQPGGGRGGFDMQAMQQGMAQISQANEAAVNKILKPAQKKRLDQIALQIEGVQAVGREEIATKINLLPAQFEQVTAILTEMRTTQGEAMRNVFQSMRGGPGGNGGPGGGPGGNGGPGANNAGGTPKAAATAKPAAPKNEDDENEAAPAPPGRGGRGNRPDPNSPEGKAAMAKLNETMTKMNDENEAVEKKAEALIAKVLTRVQKSAFNRLLGPIADIDKLASEMPVGRGGFGGPGGPGGQQGGRGNRGGGTARAGGN